MRFYSLSLIAAVCALGATSCSDKQPEATKTLSGLYAENFDATVDGKQTGLYTLTNANGMEVCITNFGGRIVSIMAPDRDGNFKDVVLGFDSIADYINIPSDFGASIGRYGNRINHGQFVLGEDTIQLERNNVDNPAFEKGNGEPRFLHHLHGGFKGWQYQVYDVVEANDSSLTLEYDSPDGDGKFPGNVKAQVKFTLTADNALDIDYTATTDKPTVINLTNHSYFNLNGDPSMPVTNLMLQANASYYTPIDSTFMTTGEIASVKETPLDFTEAKAVGEEIDVENVQIKNANGYDHNWVLDTKGDDTQVAATVVSPVTGIKLTVYTNEPGVQIYTGNFLDDTVTGKGGKTYEKHAGICLETQHYPDSPNKPEWPSTVLNPGETYHSHCVYKFDVEK